MQLPITGLGMVTCVGRNVVAAAAAIRAGISRPFPVSHFAVLDEDQEEAPLLGHPIAGFTDGFFMIGRWIRMAEASLADLLANGALPSPQDRRFWSRTGLIGVLPPLDPERFEDVEECTPELLRQSYLFPLRDLVGWPMADEHLHVLCGGRVATLQALPQVESWLNDGILDRVIVLATDSYLDPWTLRWLASHGRLKGLDNPCGLRPGEAAACFLLESPASVSRRRGRAQALFTAACADAEESAYLGEKPHHGKQLAKVVDTVLGNDLFTSEIVCDLNGEVWRAYEYGAARSRLARRLAPQVREILPCRSLGETGAAAVAIGVCLAARSFVRGYARGREALIVGSSEDGQVGAARIGAAA